MKRIESFGGSAAFAAIAAVGWLPWAVVAAPLLGVAAALSLYMVLAAVAYVALLAAGRPTAPRVTVVSAVLCAAALVMSGSVSGLALAIAALLGVVRGGILFGPPTPRALLAELLLIGGGLTLARSLAVASLPGAAAALWGFFLVQSLYFLGGGTDWLSGRWPRHAESGDPFETAYRRAVDLLDRLPG